jgi:hypothetical protein
VAALEEELSTRLDVPDVSPGSGRRNQQAAVEAERSVGYCEMLLEWRVKEFLGRRLPDG